MTPINPSAIVDALAYDFSDYSLDGFLAYLEGVTGYDKIKVNPFTFEPGDYGAIGRKIEGTKRICYIFYSDRLVGFHQTHTIYHELGHLLCGHLEQNKVYHRSDFSSLEEQQAEEVATLIRAKISKFDTYADSPMGI